MRKRFIYAATLTMGVGLLALTMVSYAASGNDNEKQKVKSEPMSGFHEAPNAIFSEGTGSFKADINDDAQTITFELTYSGLSAPAAAAHIHFGNRFNASGISAFLCGGGSKPPCPPGTTTEATVTGTITAADVIGPVNQGIAPGQFDRLVRALREGVAYANVHTATFPSGEIRGQINDQNQRQP